MDNTLTQRLEPSATALPPPPRPQVPLPPDYAAHLQQLSNLPLPPVYDLPSTEPIPTAVRVLVEQPAVAVAPLAEPPARYAPPLVSFTTTSEAPARPAFSLLRWWKQVGGGSLTFSLALHAALLILAGWMVFTTTQTVKNVDFLPGGGTQQGKVASENLAHQVQQKRRQSISKLQPLRKIVTNNLAAAVALPDAPLETLDLPSSDSLMSAGRISGGFGSQGQGGGFGGGLGLGSATGFVSMTLFGKLGGDGLPGVFFDLKQTPERQATAYAGEANEGEFASIINRLADKRFSPAMMKEFYHSTQRMGFTYLLIPYMSANEGPKSFQMEKEVQPRAWFVHYGGFVQPPQAGEYRFVGMFDDALIVYINHKPVLDGSWYSIVDYGEKRKEESIRQDFGGPVVPGTGNRRAYAGKWVRISGTTRIDIVVGERPGGRVGGMLLVQSKKGKYQTRSDGTPVLPVFSTVKIEPGDLQRMQDFAGSDNAYEIATDTPVFTLGKPLFSD